MDEKKEPQVINLNDARRARQQRAGEGGAQFCFELRDDLADDDAPLGYSGGMVTILMDPDNLSGIAFSPSAARKVAIALIESAKMAEMEEEGQTPEPPAS